MKVRRLFVAIAVIGASIAPASAPAAWGPRPCNTHTIVFSWPSFAAAALSVNFHGETCDVTTEAGSEDVDDRVIFPFAEAISLRYPDIVPGTPGVVYAKLIGLNFDKGATATLGRELYEFDPTGSTYVYDSVLIRLPDAQAASGCLDIQVYKQKLYKNSKGKWVTKNITLEKTTWRTYDYPDTIACDL
ncbi:MAG TPA: hypothetical protein VGB83_06745 [Actinomycetota bacterium]